MQVPIARAEGGALLIAVHRHPGELVVASPFSRLKVATSYSSGLIVLSKPAHGLNPGAPARLQPRHIRPNVFRGKRFQPTPVQASPSHAQARSTLFLP